MNPFASPTSNTEGTQDFLNKGLEKEKSQNGHRARLQKIEQKVRAVSHTSTNYASWVPSKRAYL